MKYNIIRDSMLDTYFCNFDYDYMLAEYCLIHKIPFEYKNDNIIINIESISQIPESFK